MIKNCLYFAVGGILMRNQASSLDELQTVLPYAEDQGVPRWSIIYFAKKSYNFTIFYEEVLD